MSLSRKFKRTGKAVFVKISEVHQESKSKVRAFLSSLGYVPNAPSSYIFHFENLDEEESKLKTFNQFQGQLFAHFTGHPTKVIHTLKIRGVL